MASQSVWGGASEGITAGLQATGQMRQNAISEQGLRALEYENKKREEQQKMLDAFVPISSLAGNIKNLPSVQKRALDLVQGAGFEVKNVGNETYIQNKAALFLGQQFKAKDELQKGLFNDALGDLNAQVMGMEKQLSESGKKPDPQIMEQYQKAKQMRDKVRDLIANTPEQAQKEALVKKGDEFAGTGGAIYNKKTGKVVYVKPEKATVEKPSDAREEIKTKGKAEAKLLENPDNPESAAYANTYNELSKTDEYVQKEVTKPGKIYGTNTTTQWVKQKKGTQNKTKVDIAQHRKWAKEAIAQGISEEKVAADFKATTGQEY